MPIEYKQNIFLELHNLKQNEKILEDYTTAFDDFMIKCDVSKAKEYIIACYLGGLRLEISNVVNLQPY